MKKAKQIPVRWYSDPAHSWLRIPRSLAERLNILDKISSYSYQTPNGKYLYLEEDCDAPTFAHALCAPSDKIESVVWKMSRHTNERSRVRYLPTYQPPDWKFTRRPEAGIVSNCCNAPTDTDTLICSDCLEHCEPVTLTEMTTTQGRN